MVKLTAKTGVLMMVTVAWVMVTGTMWVSVLGPAGALLAFKTMRVSSKKRRDGGAKPGNGSSSNGRSGPHPTSRSPLEALALLQPQFAYASGRPTHERNHAPRDIWGEATLRGHVQVEDWGSHRRVHVQVY